MEHPSAYLKRGRGRKGISGRGRVKISRKKMIALIAESFAKASLQHKFSSKLIIAIRPEDAQNFGMNLYDIKDHLVHVLK